MKNCIICGKETSRKYCSDECRLENRRREYNNRVSNGICTTCLKPNTNGKALCDSCLNKLYNATHKRRQIKKETGICRECGKPAEIGRIFCRECAEKSNLQRIALRVQRRISGTCTECGKPKIYKKARCKECYDKRRERSDGLFTDRLKNGLCRLCDNPVAKNLDGTPGILCEYHRKKKRESDFNIYWKRRQNRLCVDCGKPTFYSEFENKYYARCSKCQTELNNITMAMRHGYKMKGRKTRIKDIVRKLLSIIPGSDQ